MLSISLHCPSCGRQDIDLEKKCTCGFNADESHFARLENKGSDTVKRRTQKNLDKPESNKHDDGEVIKEINSWIFIFSQGDDCIYLGTPALQSFRLKLSLNDLEELLEFIYHKNGQENTMRKLRLSAKEIQELINTVHTMIEDKKSKITVKFSDDDLQKIEELINTKLKA